jgi:filamentous hemagglutinin family protein
MKAIVSSAIVLTVVCGIIEHVIAQVVPDNTLGTQVTQTGTTFGIDNGTRSGNNLFHSFSQFSVPTGGSAIFNNATDIQNIFSRITGNQTSNIGGILKSQGTANLFLMNPNGIVFGPNAQLQLGGSFLGTTATGIKFEDGIEFSAGNLTATPLLSVNVPIGLQIGPTPGPIQVRNQGHRLQAASDFSPLVNQAPSLGLQVKPNKTLALVGGNILLNGGVLATPQGRLILIAGASGGVGLTSVPQGWAIDAATLSSGDILMKGRSSLEASGSGNTLIQLVGRQVAIQDSSVIFMNGQGGQKPGLIEVRAAESLVLSGRSPSGNSVSSITSQTLSGIGADILIESPRMMLSDTANIQTTAFGRGQAGSLDIQASMLQLDGIADRQSTARTKISSGGFGQGRTGAITLSVDQLNILNGSLLNVSSFSTEDAGDLKVNAKVIYIDGFNRLTNQISLLSSSTLNMGNAGNLTINVDDLYVTQGGGISTSTLAGGNAGDLEINATRSVNVSDNMRSPIGMLRSTISSGATVIPVQVQRSLGLPAIPTGASGNLLINTALLNVTQGAEVKANNEGLGNAGILQINANQINVKGDSSLTAATRAGEGGNIQINAERVLIRDRSLITAKAEGAGTGGNIRINAPIIVGLDNSDITASASKGRGGNIQITTQGILGLKYRDRLTPNNDISASSEFGINGNVNVNTIGINPANALNTLPVDVVDSSRQIADRCGAAKTSSFIATGRGGMPQGPMKKKGSDRTWHDLRTNAVQGSSSVPPIAQNFSHPIVEATAFQIDKSGVIALVAPNLISAQTEATCGMSSSH